MATPGVTRHPAGRARGGDARARRGALAAATLALACACHARARPTAGPPPAGFATLEAEHQVTVRLLGRAAREPVRLRGLIAVQAPDRFRLRALGPAGLTLFDLLYVRGAVTVVEALAGRGGPALRPRLAAIARDVAAVYRLAAPGAGVRIEHRPRWVRVTDGPGGFSFEIEVRRERRGGRLDPALFDGAATAP